MICSNCGASLRDGDLFCIKCGERQPESAGITPVAKAETPLENADTVINQDDIEIKRESPEPVVESSNEPNLLSGESGQKPLYGYEPYRHELYLQAQKTESVLPVEPPVVNGPATVRELDYTPSPTTSSPYTRQYQPPVVSSDHLYRAPQPYYSPPIHHQHQPQKAKNSGGVKALPIVIALIFSSLLIMIGMISAATILASSIRESVTQMFGGYGYYPDDSSGWNDTYPDNLYPPDEGYWPAGVDYTEYEELIDDYFDMISQGDPVGIVDFLHPNVVAVLEAEGYEQKDYAFEIDGNIEHYGAKAGDYTIYGVYPYNNSDYSFLSEEFDIDQAQIQQYVNVEVGVSLDMDGATDMFYYRFDLIKVTGTWYIITIW